MMAAFLQEVKGTIVFVLVALVFAFGLYSTIGTALHTDIPVVAVTSGSMEPTFYRGDMVVVYGKPFDEIAVGDIVIYEATCMPVPIIHRVIDRSNDTLETWGDNNANQVTFCQAPNGACAQPNGACPAGMDRINVETGITEAQVLGTTAFIIPKLAYLKLIPTCIFTRIVYGPAQAGFVC